MTLLTPEIVILAAFFAWGAPWLWAATRAVSRWRRGLLAARSALVQYGLFIGLATGGGFMLIVTLMPGPRHYVGAAVIALFGCIAGGLAAVAYLLFITDERHWGGKMLRELRSESTPR